MTLRSCARHDLPIVKIVRRQVVDDPHRVFGYHNMYICDASVVASNLGVNPSLTITAIAERAMSFLPPAAEARWNESAVDCAEE